MNADDVDRKLWLDFLGKLNDRELQKARASGITPWALIGVAAIILYRCTPQLPAFLATPGALKSSFVIFTLLIDVVAYLGMAFISLQSYFEVGTEPRLLPEAARRLYYLTLVTCSWIFWWIIVMHVASALFVWWPARSAKFITLWMDLASNVSRGST